MDHSSLISGPFNLCPPLTGASNLRTISHLHRWGVPVTHARCIVQTRSITNKVTLPFHFPFVASVATTNIKRPASRPSHPATSDLRLMTVRPLEWFTISSRLIKYSEVLVSPLCMPILPVAHIVFVLKSLFPRGGCITGCICECDSFLLSSLSFSHFLATLSLRTKG